MKRPYIKYVYFVSYNFTSQDGFGWGNAEVFVSKRIKSKDDTNLIESELNKSGLKSIIVFYNFLRIKVIWK